MKKAALFLGTIFLLFYLTSTALAKDVNILLVMPNYYNTNYNLHEDNFEFMGWNITFAGVNETVRPCPNYAGPMGNPILTVDTLVSEITDVSKFDCIAIMSGSLSYGTSANDLVESDDVLNLVKAAVDSGMPVAGFTSGVRVLAAAGVINGKKVTGDARYEAEYEAAGATFYPYSFPVVDGNIITSLGVFSIEATEALAALVEKTTEAVPRKDSKTVNIRTTRVNPTSDRVLWSKTFGGSAAEGGRKVLETNDGGFVFVGYTCSQGAGNADVLIIKTDAEGNEQWTKTYGSSGWEYAYGACFAPDGGVVVTGYSNSFSNGERDAFLLKTDTDGNQQWFKTFGGDSSEVHSVRSRQRRRNRRRQAVDRTTARRARHAGGAGRSDLERRHPRRCAHGGVRRRDRDHRQRFGCAGHDSGRVQRIVPPAVRRGRPDYRQGTGQL